MGSTYVIGQETSIDPSTPKFFYGLRRTDQGELYFARVNQLSDDDAIQINNVGDPAQNYENFEQGVDFYEGRDVYHNIVYNNLNYEQYRWDNRNIFYYINSNGELVARINQAYNYTAQDNL